MRGRLLVTKHLRVSTAPAENDAWTLLGHFCGKRDTEVCGLVDGLQSYTLALAITPYAPRLADRRLRARYCKFICFAWRHIDLSGSGVSRASNLERIKEKLRSNLPEPRL
jgi:hypothetical protein